MHIRPDEELPTPPRPADLERDRADLREGVVAGASAALVCLVVGAILLPIVLRTMSSTLIAAEKLKGVGGDHTREAFVPLFLFVLFGAGFGCFLGWRISSAASLSGAVGWVIGGVAVVLLASVGTVAAMFVFPDGVPTMGWAALASMTLAALGGVGVFTSLLN